MKRIVLICVVIVLPRLAWSQDSINPFHTQLPNNIYLQNTDVYYFPMAPPDSLDTREGLCNESDLLLDLNGVGNIYRSYTPLTHDTILREWKPYGHALGDFGIWQRFFTAKRSADGTPHDIIAGSDVWADSSQTGGHHRPVIISKNEDVDFRASGTIKLKSGFHVKPGAFFHAYQEPKWGKPVFSDEFDSTALDTGKWRVVNGYNGAGYTMGANCSFDSNIAFVNDPDAHDSKAIDIFVREHSDSCRCFDNKTLLIDTFMFSTAVLISKHWPFIDSGGHLVPAYQDAPYGKYEIRDKIPHTPHYTNTWGYGTFEWDLNEIWTAGYMPNLHPGLGVHLRYGPFKGGFGRHNTGDSTLVFRSPTAGWCWTNAPIRIYVDSFAYAVDFHLDSNGDAYVKPFSTTYDMYGGFPAFLTSRTDSIVFFYEKAEGNRTDSIHWKILADASGSLRIFEAPYRHATDSLFSRTYQPISITLPTLDTSLHATFKSHNCHWVDSLNHGAFTGYLRLDDTLMPWDISEKTTRYTYTIQEINPYPRPLYNSQIDLAHDTTPYEYHTFTMELLPHELRYLMDGNVVCRVPDRLVPPGNRSYDWASRIPRSPVNIYPATFEIDYDTSDPMGVDAAHSTSTYFDRHYFDLNHTATGKGFGDVTVGVRTYPAAHHLVDYMKIWDLPADVNVAPFPH